MKKGFNILEDWAEKAGIDISNKKQSLRKLCRIAAENGDKRAQRVMYVLGDAKLSNCRCRVTPPDKTEE